MRYLDVDVADLWESIAHFAAGTYDEFKVSIHALYPGSGEERKWTMADMDKLVGEQLRIGIYSLADFGTYHRSFIQITKFLIDKNRLSTKEQSRAFVRGIQPALWERIKHRLEIKKPDNHPDDPYDLDDILKAAEYVLYDPNISTHVSRPAASSATNPSTSTNSATAVKQEDMLDTLKVFIQTLEKTLEKGFASAATANNTKTPPNHNHAHDSAYDPNCFMCSEPGHGAKDCEVTKEFIRLGKCIINTSGRIALPNGQYLPRSIVGKNFRERFNEWHRRNPGNIVAIQTSLLYTVQTPQVTSSTVFLGGTTPVDPELTQVEQIQLLERQIMALRSGKKFDGVEILRRPDAAPRQPAPAKPPPSQPEPSTSNPSASIEEPTAEKSTQVPTTSPKKVIQPVISTPSAPQVDNIANPPLHPFAPRRANYLPPQDKNFAMPQKGDPAYKTAAPIQNPKVVEDVYLRSMSNACVTLTPNELLSISAEVRQKVRESIQPKRQVHSDNVPVVSAAHYRSPLPFATIEEIEDPSISTGNHDPYSDGIVIPDVYETYLSRLVPGQVPETLTVAKESHALRSISLNVNSKDDVDAVLDPGCMIVAMSEAVCIALCIIYDPAIIINMESANGELDPSLGLARNVPCRVGEITLYLQFHVIRSPAYDILLGRPFDVLTESLIKNYANEDQIVTICDPNFNRMATIPTIPRGPPKYTTVVRPRQDFLTSKA